MKKFNYRKWLTENKVTRYSKLIKEQEAADILPECAVASERWVLGSLSGGSAEQLITGCQTICQSSIDLSAAFSAESIDYTCSCCEEVPGYGGSDTTDDSSDDSSTTTPPDTGPLPDDPEEKHSKGRKEKRKR